MQVSIAAAVSGGAEVTLARADSIEFTTSDRNLGEKVSYIKPYDVLPKPAVIMSGQERRKWILRRLRRFVKPGTSLLCQEEGRNVDGCGRRPGVRFGGLGQGSCDGVFGVDEGAGADEG